MPGYVSVFGCRVVPQEIGSLGIHDGPILWSAVFEVIGDFDGSAVFVLHGREEGVHYVCLRSVKYIDKSCNVLLLEVEPLKGSSLVCQSGLEFLKKVFRSYIELSRPQGAVGNDDGIQVPFSKLTLTDRGMLLDITTIQVRQEVPNMAMGPLFTRSRDDYDNFQKDLVLSRDRRVALIQMYRLGGIQIDNKCTGEGIANGYGFNYPGSQPGSLFVFQNGILAFVWVDSSAVLTLQRLDLQELLKKEERIPSLPTINNFSYLTKSYSNVFTGSPST